MVPDYSSCANSKSEANLKSADILTEDWRFLNKLACLNRIRHHPLNASQKHRLPAMARLCGRQWQRRLSFNTDTFRLHARGQKECQRNLGCAIGKYTYNKLKGKLEITPYTAAGAALPDGYRTRNCGSSKPEQANQEPRLCRTSQADILISVLNANNRPVQTVVQPQTQPHNPFMLVRYR